MFVILVIKNVCDSGNYYRTMKSLGEQSVLSMCTSFYPQRSTKMRSITCACDICGDYARHSVFLGVVSDLDLIIF